MGSGIVLLYMSSEAIKGYLANHPVDWQSRDLAEKGNILTPTPAIEVFFRLLKETDSFFDQEDYWQFAWSEWLCLHDTISDEVRQGLRARLYRNFYPSAIDSIHVWALLAETGYFDKCVLDTAKDAVGKTDLIAWPALARPPIKIGLQIETTYALEWQKHKRTYRGAADPDMIDVYLSMKKPKRPGNKRWFDLGDLSLVFDAIQVTPPKTEPVYVTERLL